MKRLLGLAVLSALLSSCIFLVDDTPTTPKNPTVVPVPAKQSVAAPNPGSYTYTCTGGRLVVNYVDDNLVRVFYDDAFQELKLTSNTGTGRTYSSLNYAWELDSSGRGSFKKGNQLVRTNCAA